MSNETGFVGSKIFFGFFILHYSDGTPIDTWAAGEGDGHGLGASFRI